MRHNRTPQVTCLVVALLSALIGLLFLEPGLIVADFLEGMRVSRLPGQLLSARESVFSLLSLPQLKGTAACP